MADFEPPSFSLGLDFDLLDSEPQIATSTKAPSVSNHFPVTETILEDVDEDLESLTVIDSESENQVSSPKLKRLRRGSTASVKTKVDLCSSVVVDDDDDIDDFSSQEDEHVSTHHYSVYNSSKFPLNGHGVLTKQGKRKQTVLNDPESVITSCDKPPFPKSTASPLRRFQLLDSDSDFDDPFITEGAINKTRNGSESYLNKGPSDPVQPVGLNEPRKLNESISTTRKDLWEDFQFENSSRIPTPALDEVCEEYFSSLKDKSKSQSSVSNNNHNIHVTSSKSQSGISENNQNIRVTNGKSQCVIDLDDPLPSAHQYFFHSDPRIQDLVRTRLPNFFPLNAANRDSEQPTTSNIDYMGQFSHGEKPKQVTKTNKAETSSRTNSRKSKTQEPSQGFMNPKRNTDREIPKDAGKRRVQADGQAAGKRRVQTGGQASGASSGPGAGAGAGHWFTDQNGKRVYVSKNGQELTGRAAYVLYKKETGGGFKNKKAKKSSTKKK